MENKQIKSGLLKLPRDVRDFKLGQIIKLPELSELPDEFILGDLPIKNQQGNIAGEDLCSAFASTLISEFQEGVELSPEWSFAASKEISGDVEGFGQNMRDAMKAHQKYGAVEKTEVSIPNNPRYFANWDKGLLEKAKKHFKQSYVDITGPYDKFDNLRASIWYYRNEKRAVSLGVIWSWNLADKILKWLDNDGFGHMVAVIGWKKIDGEQYIVIQNSYDKQVGENGRHYVSRKVVNNFAKRYGTMMFIDEDPSKIKQLNWTYLQILANYIALLKKMIEELIAKKQVAPIEIKPIEPPKVSRIKDWAKAIEIFENSPKNWNNPGSIKKLDGSFIKFNTYQEGFDYLCDYLIRACKGQHTAYNPENTLLEFTKIYAPSSDNNNPLAYCLFVSNRLGVKIDTKIKELL